ncbi:hypothetical protein [Thermithiobacillus plumbiphilus]|uniref:Uncharacterized protein n=1 Tax=Thermithiobacillus plumbiphilus TaxID=1729899 RepID=A0ABU9D9V2_9PROT
MTMGWLAAAILVMMSASIFDLQMLESNPSGQKQAIGKHPAEASVGIYDLSGMDPALVHGSLSSATHSYRQMESLPDHKLAEVAAACTLGGKAITESTLAGCYQAQLQVDADKDLRLWQSFSQSLKTLGGNTTGQEELLSLSPASLLETPLG